NTSGAGGPQRAAVTVVGVVANVDLRERRPAFYLPFDQHMTSGGGNGWEQVTLIVKGRRDVAPSIAGVRDVVRALDPGLSIFDVTSLRELADREFEGQRVI